MEETGFAVRVKQKITVIRHNYTTYRITLHCFMLELAPRQEKPAHLSAGQSKQADSNRPQPPVLTAASAWLWEQPDRLTRYGQPAAHRKLADMLFGQQGQGALPLITPERPHR
jgi:A/G-specific adenine glycosylase